MSCQFVLQIVGITQGNIKSRPSVKYPYISELSDVTVLDDENNLSVLAHTPSLGCDGLSDTNADVLIAPCPPDEVEDEIVLSAIDDGSPFTHSIFLSIFREKETEEEVILKQDDKNKLARKKMFKKNKDDEESEDFDSEDNEQYIAINPNISIELTESVIEKGLITTLPPVKNFKRHVYMFLAEKVDSAFSFVGICQDNIPFVMEVNNVPFAEYNHGDRKFEKGPGNPPKTNIKNKHFTKTAYFPEKGCINTSEMVKRINELTTIKKESITRCYLVYIIERTDINKFEISRYNKEYQDAVRNAIEHNVIVVPLVISWTKDGVALFVTDSLTFSQP